MNSRSWRDAKLSVQSEKPRLGGWEGHHPVQPRARAGAQDGAGWRWALPGAGGSTTSQQRSDSSSWSDPSRRWKAFPDGTDGRIAPEEAEILGGP